MKKNLKTFIDYLQTFDDVYENLGKKVLIVFDDMIADMEATKKCSPIVAELFIRRRKLNISLVFILQFYFKVPEDMALNARLVYHENT